MNQMDEKKFLCVMFGMGMVAVALLIIFNPDGATEVSRPEQMRRAAADERMRRIELELEELRLRVVQVENRP